MRKKHSIIFAAENLGGFQAILPVIKGLEKTYLTKTILAGASCQEAKKEKINFDSAKNISDLESHLLINKPDFIFTGTSRNDDGLSIEKKIIEIARREGISTASIVDGWGNYEERFSKNRKDLKYLPDDILVIDERMKKEIEKKVPYQKISITGNPSFDRYAVLLKFKTKKNLIVFFSQFFTKLNKKTGNRVGPDEVKVFRDFLESIEEIEPKKKIIIKFHPDKENLSKYDNLIRKSKLKENIRKAEKRADTEKLLREAELVVGISSTMLFKAALLCKRVVSYQPGFKGKDSLVSNSYGGSVSEGGSVPVYRKKDLLPSLKSVLLKEKPKEKNKFRQKYAFNNSTDKVINFIENKIKNSITNQKIKLIILDFDRTIVDLGVNWSLVRQKIFNFCLSVKIFPEMKNPLFKIIRDASQSLLENSKNKKLVDQLRKDLFDIIKKEELTAAKTATLIKGAKEFLEWLYQKKIRFAILSNNHNEPIVKIFKKFSLPKPAIIVGSDDVVYQKPYSEGFKKILKEIKLKPSQCLFVGDSKTDLDLSRAMGIKTFILTTYYQDKKNHYDLNANLIENFNQLKTILI